VMSLVVWIHLGHHFVSGGAWCRNCFPYFISSRSLLMVEEHGV
jgi:hypothetical protein